MVDTLNNSLMTNNNKLCGPIALKMIFDYYRIPSTIDEIATHTGVTKNGTSMFALKEMAGSKGLHAEGWRLTTDELMKATLPVILFINDNHYVVADSIVQNEIFVRDPKIGNRKYKIDSLGICWKGETLIFRKLN